MVEVHEHRVQKRDILNTIVNLKSSIKTDHFMTRKPKYKLPERQWSYSQFPFDHSETTQRPGNVLLYGSLIVKEINFTLNRSG